MFEKMYILSLFIFIITLNALEAHNDTYTNEAITSSRRNTLSPSQNRSPMKLTNTGDSSVNDESKIYLFSSDGNQHVWRSVNTELASKNIQPTVKHGGGSIMVCGSVSAAGPGKIHFIEGIMDWKMYLEILKKELPESIEKLNLNEDWYFYQDNDPKHKAYHVRLWLLCNCKHVMDTPPQSPDINPIENLWDYLKQRLRKRAITSRTSLKIAISKESGKIEPSFCEKLIKSMPSRMKLLLKNKEMHINY